MAVIDQEALALAAAEASPELVAKATIVLDQFGLPPEAGAVAGVGAVMVSVIAQWAARQNLLGADTAKIVEGLAGEALGALHAAAGLTDE